VNQLGIVIELAGAGVIVASAFRTRARIKNIEDTYDADLTTKLRDIIAGQAFTELIGFGLLAAGLLLQFLGTKA
jgi:hypothetical protein